jgi:hypothetical protein
MKLRVLCSALAALMMTGTAAAAVVDVNLGDDSFSGKFSGPLPKMGGSGAQYDLGVLVRPDDDPDLLQVYGGFLLTGDAGARDFDLAAGLGGRLIYIDRDVVDGGVFALGGQLEARLPQANRVSFSAYGYYAPSITSFADFDGYTEIGGDIGYEVIRGGSIYIGGRYIRHDYDQFGKDTADNGMHVGLRLKF